MKLLALLLILLAAPGVVQGPPPETTRALVIRCGGERLIGRLVQGRHGVGEFLEVVDRERARCHILQRNKVVPADYDCDAGACDLVRAVAGQVP